MEHLSYDNFITGNSESLIDKTEKASFPSLSFVQENMIGSSGKNGIPFYL
jgi:hypothetical protein